MLHIPKTARFTTGTRIENHFLDLLEYIYQAYYAPPQKKSEFLTQSILKNDIITFLIQTSWEAKLITNKHYSTMNDLLNEIGKMLGGWKKGIGNKS